MTAWNLFVMILGYAALVLWAMVFIAALAAYILGRCEDEPVRTLRMPPPGAGRHEEIEFLEERYGDLSAGRKTPQQRPGKG